MCFAVNISGLSAKAFRDCLDKPTFEVFSDLFGCQRDEQRGFVKR